MASIFTHVLVPIAARASLGRGIVSTRLMLVGIMASMIPDADVIGFAFKIPYGDALGHRGFTHSILFAFCCGIISAGFAKPLKTIKITAFALIFVSMVSHPLLDSLTNGGLGVAYFWPIDDTRYFLPWHPIEVSPIGLRNFLTERGLIVLKSEFLWVFLPLACVSLLMRMVRYKRDLDTQKG